jgi:SAM-dependent methyltransferase
VPGFYGEDLAAVHASGFTDLARAAAGELISRLSTPCRIVEFGCGDGTTARQLCEAGHQLHGFDVSEAMIRLATQREPRASFEVGSFVDAAIPSCTAIIAIGEVFGYVTPGRREPAALDTVFARCREALDPGGLLMFDLAGPGRLQAGEQHGWTAGPGWVVLVKARVESDTLIREIVTFRDCGRSRYRRSDETHRLQLHRPADVLAQLRRNGFTARTLRSGYGTIALPRGLTAYIAKRERGSPQHPGQPARHSQETDTKLQLSERAT